MWSWRRWDHLQWQLSTLKLASKAAPASLKQPFLNLFKDRQFCSQARPAPSAKHPLVSLPLPLPLPLSHSAPPEFLGVRKCGLRSQPCIVPRSSCPISIPFPPRILTSLEGSAESPLSPPREFSSQREELDGGGLRF